MPEQEIITWTSAHAALPLFAFWKFAVGPDMTIGGLVLDSYAQGKAAVTLARNILAGNSAHTMPQTSGDGQFVFSRSQLARWRIELPQDIAEQSTFLP